MLEHHRKKQYSGIKSLGTRMFRGNGSRFEIESECNRITVKLAFYLNPGITFSDKSAE